MRWLKLTPADAEALAALTATNPGPHFLQPVPDANGELWLSGDVFEDRATFAHYSAFFDGEFLSSGLVPAFPQSEL